MRLGRGPGPDLLWGGQREEEGNGVRALEVAERFGRGERARARGCSVWSDAWMKTQEGKEGLDCVCVCVGSSVAEGALGMDTHPPVARRARRRPPCSAGPETKTAERAPRVGGLDDSPQPIPRGVVS